MSNENPRSKWLIVSLILVAVVVIAAVVIVIVTGLSDDEAQNDIPMQDAQTANVEPSECGLEADANMNMDQPPANSDSITVGLATVPASETTGPADMYESVPVCWQYSEAGAVQAAYTFAAVASDAPRLTLDHLKAHLADGPGRDELISKLENADSMGTDSVPIQPVGYRVLNFSDDRADIDVLVENPDDPGVYGALTSPLVWQHGDWKLEVQDDGEYYNEFRDVSNPSEFTFWEADSS